MVPKNHPRSVAGLSDALKSILQSDRLRIEHWAASPAGEAIAVNVDDIDIAGSIGNAFLQNFDAFYDQCQDKTVNNFVIRDRPAGNSPST